ncbi:MAG: hypothetical protein KJ792_03000 [Actinobacteria bacterium]|nr:hypothetical protein [Actinomycetota bacterium]MCG2801463.1 hypothetical protein [Cellulomonas sp.]
MTESIWVAVIGQTAATLAALAALGQSRRTRSDLAGSTGDGRPIGERLAVVETRLDGHSAQLDRIVQKLDA